MTSHGVDVSTVYAVHKLRRQNARLKETFRESDSWKLMKDIERLEAQDKELECIVDNLHKEVDQVVRAAKRLTHVAALEHNEALERVNRAKLCIETIIEEEGDFLSDPDAFVASYCERLDAIVDKLEEDLGATASFMQIDNDNDPDASPRPDCSPLEALNEATRRKLLVQVEIERVNEEIRAELEYSATTEPISHPILDVEEDKDLDAEADISNLPNLPITNIKQPQMPSFAAEIYASNKETNICIQNAVSHLTAQAAQS